MRIYDIQLMTPLGRRNGELRAEIQNGKLQGAISLLGRTELIDGVVTADGVCKFCGRLITLLHTIEYCATGKIGADTVSLSLNGKERAFSLIGTVRRET